eukprot:CAMPEP_0119309740 /NCGR_PEP_ID=MMETSP1333-20130426/16391_1 /TAXON_ID=418940 /ORGANISM="Scyphosphaera apsteinii, Strain RCC1455" /LENGTH=198 /DNA_ID=CAMNT_0007313755 /DNA_START=67 /DNA_END=663 /DNA_ORIENTATION=+
MILQMIVLLLPAAFAKAPLSLTIFLTASVANGFTPDTPVPEPSTPSTCFGGLFECMEDENGKEDTTRYKVCGHFCGSGWCGNEWADEDGKYTYGNIKGARKPCNYDAPTSDDENKCIDQCCKVHDQCCNTDIASDKDTGRSARKTCNGQALDCADKCRGKTVSASIVDAVYGSCADQVSYAFSTLSPSPTHCCGAECP